MGAIVCHKCGLNQGDWVSPNGYRLRDKNYCCVGCAIGLVCICVENDPEPIPPAPAV